MASTAPALGAYSVYVLHAGVDWDWEVTAVTLTAIVLGGCLLGYARRDDSGRSLSLPGSLPECSSTR